MILDSFGMVVVPFIQAIVATTALFIKEQGSREETQPLLSRTVLPNTSAEAEEPLPLISFGKLIIGLTACVCVVCAVLSSNLEFESLQIGAFWIDAASWVLLFVAVFKHYESRLSYFSVFSFISVVQATALLVVPNALSQSWFLLVPIKLALSAVVFGVLVNQSLTVTARAIESRDTSVKSRGNLLPAPEPASITPTTLFPFLFFTWVNPLIRFGAKHPITLLDMPVLPSWNSSAHNVKTFSSLRNRTKSLWTALFYFEFWSFVAQFSFGMTAALSGLAGPYFLYQITGFIEFAPKGADPTPAFLAALAFGLCAFLKKFCDNHAWNSARNMSIRIKAVIVDEIYAKSLRRIPAASTGGESTKVVDGKGKPAANEDASVGKIVTLMTTDAESIREYFAEIYEALVDALHIVGSVVGLLFVVGWPALVGLAVMMMMLPLTYFNSRWNLRVYDRLLAAQDKRTGVVNEVLQGIRVIKYFAWEKRFLAKIDEARTKEMHTLIQVYLADGASNFIWLMTPLVVSFATLTALTKFSDIKMTSQMAFTCLALFNSLRVPLMYLPLVIANILKMLVAGDRVGKFLDQDELEIVDGTEENIPTVCFDRASFQWYDSGATDESFELRDLNVSFPIGKLTAICGATGAGKSSLLQALLGEMKRTSGNVHLSFKSRSGEIAYVPQTSWLLNASIRDNIIFGLPYDPVRYDHVIKACSLVKDLATLEAGDLTEIGERGINISGGQKQRVSLARALYSRAKLILLDDPLSAVDAPTARHLFEHAICGPLMEGRTRILVTHAAALVLKDGIGCADYVVAMNNGSIVGAGFVPEILEDSGVQVITGLTEETSLRKRGSNAALSTMVKSTVDSSSAALESEVVDYSNGKSGKKLIEEETKSSGTIKTKYYKLYISSAGGVLFLVVLFSFNALDRVVRVFNDYWIKLWADSYRTNDAFLSMAVSPSSPYSFLGTLTALTTKSDLQTKDSDVDYYVMMYGLIGVLWVVVFLTGFFVRSVGSYIASKKFHKTLIERIVYAPMSWFDKTPVGRILNRATKDISVIDNGIMSNFEQVVGTVMDAFAVLAVVIAITPVFIVTLVPIFIVYYQVSSRFLKCQREMKRLDSITRSPIYSMFSETLVGVSTVRAYGAQQRFIEENQARVDTNARCFYYMYAANRWFGVRTALIGGTVILCAALATVSLRDVVGAGLAGLSLTWTLQFGDYLVWIVRVQAALEMNLNAVERVDEYSEIEQERPAVIESNRPPANWPQRGAITVSNLEMRYSPDQEPVLHNVSFSVKGGEKVGIVGRTGAGKSSLSLSLFRIVEPSNGSIKIDGIDISTIGLYDLRSKITMIPQDPVLFQGTIRSNLDPFEEFQDSELWACLRDIKFWESMQTADTANASAAVELSEDTLLPTAPISGSLEASVAEGGTNFSQGQRQLLCLARAMLKRSVLTVFDEATASVDNETDANIQRVIRGPAFEDTTLLSIVHRLRTIADYDKVLVLDKGRVMQFGTPAALMQEDGIFKTMCKDTGEYEELLMLATSKIKIESHFHNYKSV